MLAGKKKIAVSLARQAMSIDNAANTVTQ